MEWLHGDKGNMAERDPIDLIKEQLNGIEKLTGLHADHEAFQQWYNDTRTILEKVFSSKSIHYQNFVALKFREMSVKAFASPEIDKINVQRYRKDLENVRNVLQGAIKELTLDRTLFKKIQTTPRTVEVSLKGEYFISSGISDLEMLKAVESAFEGTGLEPIRGSEAIQKGSLINQRIDQIRRARLGIYPLTPSGKEEVLIEIGIALGLGKEILLLYKKGTPFPGLLRQLNSIEYEHFSDLTEKLKKRIG
jgi:hypothetical protein